MARIQIADPGTSPRPRSVYLTQDDVEIQRLGRFVAKVKLEHAPKGPESSATNRFERTIRKMLATPPKPHEEMKMGTARKRDTRSSGKGSGK